MDEIINKAKWEQMGKLRITPYKPNLSPSEEAHLLTNKVKSRSTQIFSSPFISVSLPAASFQKRRLIVEKYHNYLFFNFIR